MEKDARFVVGGGGRGGKAGITGGCGGLEGAGAQVWMGRISIVAAIGAAEGISDLRFEISEGLGGREGMVGGRAQSQQSALRVAVICRVFLAR